MWAAPFLAHCRAHCTHRCGELNGEVQIECSDCDGEEWRCRPGQPGFSTPEAGVGSAAQTAHGEDPTLRVKACREVHASEIDRAHGSPDVWTEPTVVRGASDAQSALFHMWHGTREELVARMGGLQYAPGPQLDGEAAFMPEMVRRIEASVEPVSLRELLEQMALINQTKTFFSYHPELAGAMVEHT